MGIAESNMFGWPLFSGKIDEEEDAEVVHSTPVQFSNEEYWINITNDFSKVAITKDKKTRVDESEIEMRFDNQLIKKLIVIAAEACYKRVCHINRNSKIQFIVFIVMSVQDGDKTEPLNRLKAALETPEPYQEIY